MTAPVAIALPQLSLSTDEQSLIVELSRHLTQQQPRMYLDEQYYLGEQTLVNLGIAIPKELESIRTVIGWPAVAAVDPLADRCNVLGFRLRGATDDDMDLWDLWDASNLPGEQSLLHTDALTYGSGWYTVGEAADAGDPPLIRVESPMHMAGKWDARTLRLGSAWQQYKDRDTQLGVLYLPDQNVYVEMTSAGWKVTNRTRHNAGRPLAVRAANRPRTRTRHGVSEITPAIRSITDSACRALLNLQVAGEIYGVPRRYILGATESDYQSADGTPKTAWQTYITSMLALERDENGEVPTVGQFPAYDPSAFTKVLDFYAAQMAAHTGATPQELGLYTQGNPPSADSVQYAEGRRNRAARKRHAWFGIAHAEVIRLAMILQNGSLPADMRHIEVDWEDPSVGSFESTSRAVSALVNAGVIPPTSDVTLQRLGFTPIERQWLAQDRVTDQGEAVLRQIAAGGTSANQG